jgi:ADP-heptose:LPS heptosyltransferase
VHHEPGPARKPTPGVWFERRGKHFMARMLRMILRPRPISDADLERLEVRELLVIRQHNQMGDMVLCLPTLHALRERWPQARLRFVTAPICRELLQDHGDIDELLVFHKRAMRRPTALWTWLRHLQRPRADLAIVLGSVSFSTTSALLALLSRARVRIGASSRPFGSELSDAVYHRELTAATGVHEVERNLSTLQALGIHADGEPPRLWATPQARATAQAFLVAGAEGRQEHRTVVLHTGAGKLPNVWPAEYFARLANQLVATGNVRIVLTEGPRDAAIVDAVERQASVPMLRWRRTLGETMGLLQASDLIISNDTGMAHVAAALQRPTLVLFGPTDAQRWRPAGSGVRVQASPSGRIIDLPVQAVLGAALEMLQSERASVRP